ncbi:MAG: TonB-dependent receptor [Burkholderiales bacterium]|uniref:TonB-dependent receptor domain-containing protein n=1 Tax=Nitrosomonas sp. TaxID=42353 RepID=UPI001D46B9D8|nr:TonB-dependent receptor [Nitrosomonas sp.]MCB1950099.1 TonB-dependent receptor [Nitrosomonas sp.]MCP5242721.1 TonB-dependent receptor [Burkholderiales bacterium]
MTQNNRIKSLSHLFALLTVCLLSVSAWSDTKNQELAEFSIHLFQEGMPVADAVLTILSVDYEVAEGQSVNELPVYSWGGDDQAALKTNTSGSIAAKLPPGKYHMTLTAGEQSYNFDLPLQPSENVQILLTFFPDGREPLLNIESSATGTMAGADALDQMEQVEGDGRISVQVLSAETNRPVRDVQVFVSGLRQQLRTDEKGHMEATIPIGNYSVSLLHPAYSSQTQDGVEISLDQTTELSFTLTPAGVELAEFVVLEPHLAGTLASVIEEQKSSTEVTTVMGAEQFSRSGDSDVASALRRASGLTLIGGQFIFIRGLGERYSSTLVNGAAVPSPDPTRRVVPLNLFPTNFLDNVMVQKTYSADRPGEFAGGTLEMRTRGIPDEFFFNLSASTGFNDRATFADGLTYKGGGLDFLSFDDGARALPDSIAAATANGQTLQPQTPFNPNGFTPQEIETFGEDLSGVWDVTDRPVGPDRGLNAAIGNVFDVGNFRAGFIAAGGWEQQFRKQNEINREYTPTQSGGLRNIQDFDTKRSLQSMELNGYLGADIEYKNNHRIFSRTMFLRQAVDEARIVQGFTDAEVTDIRRTKLWFLSNQLFSQQVGGNHQFNWAKDLSINWLYTNATAKRDQPKTRDYRFDQMVDGSFALSRRADSNQTTYANLIDKDQSWRMDAKLPLEFSPKYTMALHGGFITQDKARNSRIQRFAFFPVGPLGSAQDIISQPSLESILQPSNIGPDGFQLRDTTRPTDNYNATQKLFSYYGKMDFMFYDRVGITGGARWEKNDQFVETFQSIANSNQSVVSTINRTDMLPSATATLFISDRQQFRAGFSQTLSRPDFRELSPAPFTDLNTNQETTGNPDLKQTAITNYDVRWEYYPSANESMMASFFWKDLTRPIELVTLPGTAGLQTYQNADSARVFGFEAEFLKGLGFIHPWLENFYAGGNYTWSSSRVKLNADNLGAQTTNNRQLQGHSAQIVNFQVGYENPGWGTQMTLLYNVTSRHIVSAGLLGAPDKYQQPFHQLDFVFNQTVNKWLSVRLNMQNLLDDDVLILQGGELTRQFRRGRQFNLGVRINF